MRLVCVRGTNRASGLHRGDDVSLCVRIMGGVVSFKSTMDWMPTWMSREPAHARAFVRAGWWINGHASAASSWARAVRAASRACVCGRGCLVVRDVAGAWPGLAG